MRRLELQRLSSASPGVESASESEPETPPTPRVNAFALLGGESSEESESEEEEPVPQPTPVRKPVVEAKKTSKKKKEAQDDADLDKFLAEVRERDLAKSKTALATASQEDFSQEPDFEQNYEEEPTPVAYSDSNYLYFTTSRLKQCLHLLSVGSSKNLDADTELKNLFGNLSLEAIEDGNSTTSLATSPEVLAQFKKLARLTRGWGGRDHRNVPGTTRKLLLTRIKDDWLPTAQKPLHMEDLTRDDVVRIWDYKEEEESYEHLERKAINEEKLGVRYFRFSKVSSVTERVANSRFYASVVMTPDPDSLMQLLQQHPYHVETLLQVAMVILRQGNDKATSNALVEKALFVFDRSFNKRFHELLQEAKTGLIRLPYEGYVNRQFYLCLFRVISGHGERSTFFTALNYCKLLLSLSPAEDPVGVRYFIDHYALLSEEYEYLVKLVDSPLTHTYGQWYTPGLAFSAVLALLHLGKTKEAKASLKRAFNAHPYCAYKLLETVGLATQIPVSLNDIQTGSHVMLASETCLVRAPLVWKEQTHRDFLHNELYSLFEQKKSGDKSSWLGKLFGSTTKESSEIPLNLLRFAVLSGENKLLAKVPEMMFERDDVHEYDVLPPKDETSGYDVYTGVDKSAKATDSLFDYLDHNIIGAIVQNRTGNELEDLLAGFGEEDPEQAQ